MAAFLLTESWDSRMLVALIDLLDQRGEDITYTSGGRFRGVVKVRPGPLGDVLVEMHPADLERFRQKCIEEGEPLKPIVDRPGETN